MGEFMTQIKLEDVIKQTEPIKSVKRCIAPHFMAKVERKRKIWKERREEFIKWMEDGNSVISGFGKYQGKTFPCRLCDKPAKKYAYVKPALPGTDFRIFSLCEDCFKKYGW